jgi:hypothetical protein
MGSPVTKYLKVGDSVVHRLDAERKPQTVIEIFPWLGNRKIVTEDFKDWENYFLASESNLGNSE